MRSLGVTLADAAGVAREREVLHEVAFTLARGESLGVVGSSGAGKSTLGAALLRLLPEGARVAAGATVRFEDEDLLTLDAAAMRARRGRRIGMVFQEPLQALDPAMTIGEQLTEGLLAHGLVDAAEARERALAMISRVGIGDAVRAAARYPHEFSGGMRQRLLIAAAVLLEPALLIADEPTTALDATIQAQVLDLLDTLRAASGTAMLLISHDLDVVAERCDRILVLDEGRVAEIGSASQVAGAPSSEAGRRLANARHRRTAPRVAAAVAAGVAAGASEAEPLLAVRDLAVHYPERRRGAKGERQWVRAVDGVSLTVRAHETVGLVGESGCGKTTLAHAVLRLVPAVAGSVRLGGTELLALEGETLRQLRRRMQLVPQDAGASLTPHLTAGELVAEGLEVHGLARGGAARARAQELLAEVGLPARAADARTAQLSSGERQRVAIARALAPEPALLVCDEPVASVDASTRGLLLELFERLRRDRGVALLLISHDLASVRRVADRVLVMYGGRLVETGPAAAMLDAPRMPYTQALTSAVPTGDPADRARRIVLAGEPPSPLSPPAGCPFFPRCQHPMKDAQCTAHAPPLREVDPGHGVACWKV